MRRVLPWIVLAVLLLAQARTARADSPSCSFQPDGSIECHTGGSGGDQNGGDNGGEGTGSQACDASGLTHGYGVRSYDPVAGTCEIVLGFYTCSGELVLGGEQLLTVPCSPASPPPNPCDTFSVTAGGITCGVFDWDVKARVTFPEIYLDVRPYPATLVRWPTAGRGRPYPRPYTSAV